MESRYLLFSILILLSVIGAEKYDFQMKLNNTSYSMGFFFNHEIYAGKTMTIKVEGSGPLLYGIKVKLNPLKVKIMWDILVKSYVYKKGPSIEDKYCAESLRTLMDYVISKLGKNVKPLLSSFVKNQDQYRVEGVTNIGQKAVMCHRMNFQKATFYCHEVHATTVYSDPLVASDGTKTKALAVCHFNTSGMNKKWICQVMKVDPGTKPVCHFLGSKEVLWVPN